MRLVPCVAPSEPLDTAPRTALLRDLDLESRWDGFWSHSSDAYYARCTTTDGAVKWYQMADESTADTQAPIQQGALDEARALGEAEVLPFRAAGTQRVSLIVAASPGGRPMLVGSGRRAVRQ